MKKEFTDVKASNKRLTNAVKAASEGNFESYFLSRKWTKVGTYIIFLTQKTIHFERSPTGGPFGTVYFRIVHFSLTHINFLGNTILKNTLEKVHGEFDGTLKETEGAKE